VTYCLQTGPGSAEKEDRRELIKRNVVQLSRILSLKTQHAERGTLLPQGIQRVSRMNEQLT
jgi:hypothetical protein